MNVHFDEQPLEIVHFSSKAELIATAPDVYERVKESVFYESDPRMAKTMEQTSGTVVRGDVAIAHPDAWPETTFERIYEVLGDVGRWLIFDGSLSVAGSIYLDDGTPRVIVLGNLDAVGVANYCGELQVEGATKITGALFFNSDDGGFTRLSLSEPVGFIATSANMFMIELKARYFFDRLLRTGFEEPSTTRHEEIIKAAFATPPTVITREHLAAFFTQKLKLEEAAAKIRSGEEDYIWIVRVITDIDSRALVSFLDEVTA